MDLGKMICDEVIKYTGSAEFNEYIKKAVKRTLENSVDNMFGYGNPIKKQVEEQLKAVMVKSLENITFTDYLPKIDSVLTQVVNESRVALYKRMTDNLRVLLVDEEIPEKIKVSEIFTKYKEYCSEWVNTSELEIDYDGVPRYYDLTCIYNVEDISESKIIKDFVIQFRCDEDESLNKNVKLKNNWSKEEEFSLPVSYYDIRSLRYLDSFETFLLRLSQKGTKIVIDEDNGYDDEVEVDATPECYFE
jgi:hypothetical protein|nr:MAG TPA: hypothetical protein [Caudoviricetes sp.]